MKMSWLVMKGGLSMKPLVHPIRSVEHVAAQYVAARGKRGGLISTADAVRALRLVLSNCPLSDRELANSVARVAVRRGCSISFEGAGNGAHPRQDTRTGLAVKANADPSEHGHAP